MDEGKHDKSMHSLACNAYAGIKIFLVNSTLYLIQLRKDFHNSLKTKGKVEISLSTEKQKNIKELIQVLNAEMYLTYTKKQYMKSISIHSPKYNEVLLC